MSEFRFGDVLQRKDLLVIFCSYVQPPGDHLFDDGYRVMGSDLGWGVTIRNESGHHNYPLGKTCVIAGPEAWTKVEL